MAARLPLRQNTDTSGLPAGRSAAGPSVTAAHPRLQQYPDTVDLRIAHAGREAR